MTKWQRIKSVFSGLVMLLSGLAMAIIGENAISIIVVILSLSMIFEGLRMLIFYFSMARHMVDGDRILISGLIKFDIGVFTASMAQFTQLYVMGYLLAAHAFSGFIDVLRALEAKRLDSPSWKLSLSTGVINILIGMSCIVFIRSMSVAVYIYSAGLIYSAVVKIIQSFKKTAVVYITPS